MLLKKRISLVLTGLTVAALPVQSHAGLGDWITRKATDAKVAIVGRGDAQDRNVDDATPREMSETAIGFNVSISNNVASNRASVASPELVIEGKIFSRCAEEAPEFQIAKRDIISDIDGSHGLSIQFKDPTGKMRDCMSSWRAEGRSCATDTCVPLSNFGKTIYPLADYDSHVITAYVQGSQLQFEPSVEVQDAFSRQRRAAVMRTQMYQQEAQPVISRYMDVLQDCANTPEQVEVKRRALEKVSNIQGGLVDGQWKAISRQIDDEELRVLVARANSAPLNELPELENKLTPLEVSNPEMAVTAYLRIADSYARSQDKMGLQRAVTLLKRVKNVSSNPSTQAQVELKEWEYRFERLKAQGAGGSLNPWSAQQELQKLVYELEQRRMQVCGNGTFASPEMCSALTQHLQKSVREVQGMSQQGWQNRMYLNQMRVPNSVPGYAGPVGMGLNPGLYPVPYNSYPIFGGPVMMGPMGTGMVPIYRAF